LGAGVPHFNALRIGDVWNGCLGYLPQQTNDSYQYFGVHRIDSLNAVNLVTLFDFVGPRIGVAIATRTQGSCHNYGRMILNADAAESGSFGTRQAELQ
jgi:hypothetical protein